MTGDPLMAKTDPGSESPTLVTPVFEIVMLPDADAMLIPVLT